MHDLEVLSRLVTNRNQRISFVGTRLAFVSAQRHYSPRWAELELFRVWDRDGDAPCPDPAFVFTRTGRSRVYHLDRCPSAPTRLPFGHEISLSMSTTDLSPCPSCSPQPPPPDVLAQDFLTTHRFEITRHYARVCSDAVALAAELAPVGRSAPRYAPLTAEDLPWLSSRLVCAAALHDDYLAAQFGVRTSVPAPAEV